MSVTAFELNGQTGAVPEPTWAEMLQFAGCAPEVWLSMTDARREEWRRSYEFHRQRAAGVEKGADAHVA